MVFTFISVPFAVYGLLDCSGPEPKSPANLRPNRAVQERPSAAPAVRSVQSALAGPHHRRRFITFSLRPDGSINSARLAAAAPLADFSFEYQDLLLKPAEKKT
jgi:hypothetical protein